ncbi:MAG: long-chain fatty acid--CoA ligase [Verrucomicrobia bacterium]|nr:long-chain fatty acid--CoA ligase [Verrucomicrobiota bacterium]
MNLATAFATTAARHAARTALFWGEEEFTYSRLASQTRRVAQRLVTAHAVRPGDRVGLWLRNCPEFVPALFGALEAGAAVVPINNFLKPDEVNYILADAGIDVLITEDSMNEAFGKLLAARPALRILRIEEFASLPSGSHEDGVSTCAGACQENDLAVIIYTSGTTGHPKGAMLSHGNLLHNVESCRQMLAAVAEDRFVAVLPMFHSFMLTVCVLLPLLVGGSIVLVRSLHPPKNVILEIHQRGGTILPAVPPFFRALANSPVPPGFPLRICISGGAPLPVQLLRDFSARMPMPLIEGYGLSEASPVVSMNPLAGPWKEGSIGVPVPSVEMSVQDDDGKFLSPHQTGEVCVRGGNVMLGYWNQPAETARTLRHGWLLTGDVGHCDADGYYYITDRKKDMLLVNGINVYPREIEEVIYQLSAVKEAAVIGVPDARKGEQPLAFVSPKEGATVDEKAVLDYIREKLADFKLPKRVVVMESLPHNATGKILKTTLRKMV